MNLKTKTVRSKIQKVSLVVGALVIAALLILNYLNQFDKNQREIIALYQQQPRTPSGTAFWQKGTGEENIIFLHGWFATKYSFQDLSQLLPDSVHQWAIDIKGYGFTKREGNFALSAQVNQLKQFVTENNIHHFTLVGHSMGGSIAQAYAVLFPEDVKRLVLVSSSDFFWNDSSTATEKRKRHPAYSLLESQFGQWILSKTVGRLLVKSILKPLFADQNKIKEQAINEYGYPTVLPEFWVNLPKVLTPEQDIWLTGIKEKISRSTLPVSIIWGEKDTWFPVSQGKKIASEYKNSRLFIIPHTGHIPHEEEPVVVANILNQIWDQK